MTEKKRKSRKGLILMYGGLLFVIAALALIFNNYIEELHAGDSVLAILEEMDELKPIETPSDIPDYIRNPDMPMPTIEIDGHAYIGTLTIPSLDRELPVMEEWSYPNLKISPCRYSGSVYKNDMIVAAHNYQSHFGTLKYLNAGDEVMFTDVRGNEFHFEVVQIDTLQKYAVSELKAGDWDLTLFTCTIGGETRVTVRCVATD